MAGGGVGGDTPSGIMVLGNFKGQNQQLKFDGGNQEAARATASRRAFCLKAETFQPEARQRHFNNPKSLRLLQDQYYAEQTAAA